MLFLSSGKTQMDPQGDHCVARYPEKSGMPERHQSGIAYDQAQAHGKNGKNQYLGNNAKKVISGERGQCEAQEKGGKPHRPHRRFHVTPWPFRSEEHTSELQSLMRISYAVFCLKKKKQPY